MKKLIALVCFYSFSLNSIASTFEPFSTTFFLRQHASDRDVIELVACSAQKKSLSGQSVESVLFGENCQAFGNEEGYSLALIERLDIFSATTAANFANSEKSKLQSNAGFTATIAGVYTVLALLIASLTLQAGNNVEARNALLRRAGAAFIPAIPLAAAAFSINNRAVNHFDVDTYREVGSNIDNIDYQELEQAEIIYFSLASVDRGPGGERSYKKKVNQVKNALVHILKDAEF